MAGFVHVVRQDERRMSGPTRPTNIDDALVVYTDGACSGNPGPGGWAWAVSPTGEPCASGGERNTTNQRMELTAVLEALQTNLPIAHAAVKRLVIVSDSTYVVNCFKDRWWVRWKANGWRNAKKEPVANDDLWRPLIEMYESLSPAERPDFQWVKGHSGDPMNDIVDALAVAATPPR